jgi:hypothetical protein
VKVRISRVELVQGVYNRVLVVRVVRVRLYVVDECEHDVDNTLVRVPLLKPFVKIVHHLSYLFGINNISFLCMKTEISKKTSQLL